MTPEELEDLRSQSDILLFLSFRNLYDFAKRSGMSPEQGKREKSQILDAYRINKLLEEIQEGTNQMWKRIEIASATYRKNPTVETADVVMKEIYRVERKIFDHG